MKNTSYLAFKSASKHALRKSPTEVKSWYQTDEDYSQQLETYRTKLDEYQAKLFASHSRSVLIVFQGMDAAGKDGAISHVMSGLNAQGATVKSFKVPSATELDHDFLWRINLALPERGQIGIFNRSYYEEVLITRVHPELLKDENLPNGKKTNQKFWDQRCQDIVNHEKYLHRQGYEIIKIFLHISKDEQKKRFLKRFDDPNKTWKINPGDLKEREFWDEYQDAYEACIRETSSHTCPWYIVPGDDKKNARLMISEIVTRRLKAMKLEFPKLSPKQAAELKKLKAKLEQE